MKLQTTVMTVNNVKKVIVMNKRMLDIVEIKVAKYLKFFIEDKYIYCENIVTGERVIVGEIDAED